ncbi:uncharacterized protein LOC111353105 isoform X1 [Spodoptera litura]|uniref:Uncharacterized protein LOC111353105 isoform X1 n=2 Tax=Spodoptera litura TaxID=69820 RepID=A0A9J7INM3_SPOLT|nr:uncharacterized protein LOC111353105 isoform X1 [Spodoptera litura]
MFASKEKNVCKKTFQKPNILRRKGMVTVSKANVASTHESPEAFTLVTSTTRGKPASEQLDNIVNHEDVNVATWKLTLRNDCEDKHNNIQILKETDIHANISDNTSIMEIKNESKSFEQNALNIESFLNSADSIEEDLSFSYNPTEITEMKASQSKSIWCFDITNNSRDIIINNYKEEPSEEQSDSTVVAALESTDVQPKVVHDLMPLTKPTQTIAIDCYTNRAVKFKCDHPNCNKGFWSEEKLRKHKNSHNRPVYRPQTQMKYECPVKKAEDGTEEKCPRTYNVRGDLLKHLEEDHTTDEAHHRLIFQCSKNNKIMFASKEKNVCKKTLPKPNILRRQLVTVPVVNVASTHESPEAFTLVTSTTRGRPASEQLDNIVKHEDDNVATLKLTLDNEQPSEEQPDSTVVAALESADVQPKVVHDLMTLAKPTQTVAVDCYTNRAVKFKCDHPNCNKGFWSEEKLRKHKNSHNRPVYRPQTQMKYECPVKKVAEDGTEEKCPRTYNVRSDLLKHLEEDHTIDEAQHRCMVCGRRFFWALGLRAHGASVCARGGLACAWPGCGRVFRLPCRLREHARAHTGDRPYLCRYPECGWAFRSASKLVRHARRHTDERRHACATCGRAFLRREHLRDHCARHHQPHARTPHLCTHPGCEQSFTNMSTLYMHMKKVHRKVEQDAVASIVEDPAQYSTEPVTLNGENVYLVHLPSADTVGEDESVREVSSMNCELDADQLAVEGVGGDCGEDEEEEEEVGVDGEDGAGEGEGGEWHAARTHCTWPLPRAQAHLVLDDDVQVERIEGSVNDVYTVRSDLFLHGNVPIDEDSQQIVSTALSSSETGTLDTDLYLIDSHPTIDLMQEELMYEDANDESSFRVFLMNGEELT